MLIPIRCTNCGKILGDKYNYYNDQLRIESGNVSLEPFYFDGTNVKETKEKKICKKMGLRRYCCIKIMIAHKDLIKKV